MTEREGLVENRAKGRNEERKRRVNIDCREESEILTKGREFALIF